MHNLRLTPRLTAAVWRSSQRARRLLKFCEWITFLPICRARTTEAPFVQRAELWTGPSSLSLTTQHMRSRKVWGSRFMGVRTPMDTCATGSKDSDRGSCAGPAPLPRCAARRRRAEMLVGGPTVPMRDMGDGTISIIENPAEHTTIYVMADAQ